MWFILSQPVFSTKAFQFSLFKIEKGRKHGNRLCCCYAILPSLFVFSFPSHRLYEIKKSKSIVPRKNFHFFIKRLETPNRSTELLYFSLLTEFFLYHCIYCTAQKIQSQIFQIISISPFLDSNIFSIICWQILFFSFSDILPYTNGNLSDIRKRSVVLVLMNSFNSI